VLAAKAGFFPLDQQLELWDGHWSEGVVRQAVWLSGLVCFEEAEAILRQIGRVNISGTSVWRRTQTWGAKLQQQMEAERRCANALPGKWEAPHREIELDRRMGVAMDGTMVHIREEGWKELKLGCVFDVDVQPAKDKATGDTLELAHAVNNTYVAHLGGPEMLGELVWAEAQRRGWERARDTEVVGDGAQWIWNLVALHFGDSLQLVDWYHAKEHLVAAGRLLKGEGTLAFQRWLNSRETMLYQGHAARLADELATAATEQPDVAEKLTKEAAYFHNHQHRMNYLEMREEEWPLGSGMVESGGKQFKARFCGPGMRWSRSGAENLLPVRTAILSNRFDELWLKAYNSPPT
jgi:hypothetical protein